jgi:hypothetical protein
MAHWFSFSKRLISYNLWPRDVFTIISGLEILAQDEPKWKAECEEIRDMLRDGLNARRASRVLP